RRPIGAIVFAYDFRAARRRRVCFRPRQVPFEKLFAQPEERTTRYREVEPVGAFKLVLYRLREIAKVLRLDAVKLFGEIDRVAHRLRALASIISILRDPALVRVAAELGVGPFVVDPFEPDFALVGPDGEPREADAL